MTTEMNTEMTTDMTTEITTYMTREMNTKEISLNHRLPDILLNVVCLTHLGVALLITELIAHDIAQMIVLEGVPLGFEQHYLRLRWICARFNVKLIVLGD